MSLWVRIVESRNEVLYFSDMVAFSRVSYHTYVTSLFQVTVFWSNVVVPEIAQWHSVRLR